MIAAKLRGMFVPVAFAALFVALGGASCDKKSAAEPKDPPPPPVETGTP